MGIFNKQDGNKSGSSEPGKSEGIHTTTNTEPDPGNDEGSAGKSNRETEKGNQEIESEYISIAENIEADLFPESELSEQNEIDFTTLTEVTKMGFGYIDQVLKDAGGVGLGSKRAQELKAKLGVKVASRHITEEHLQKTPEYALAVLLGGDILVNSIAIRKALNNNTKSTENE